MTITENNMHDILDVRSLIERFEELEDQLFNGIDEEVIPEATPEHDEALAEYNSLQLILEGLCGYGGDEQWRGDWYPITLIHDSYFVEYVSELVSDIGDLPRELPSYIEIDWYKTAGNVRADYSCINIDGVDYWYR